jgi:hypothetical protein
MIAGAFREHGLRTYAKTTGTLPRMIMEDGREYPIYRPTGANIIEQLRALCHGSKHAFGPAGPFETTWRISADLAGRRSLPAHRQRGLRSFSKRRCQGNGPVQVRIPHFRNGKGPPDTKAPGTDGLIDTAMNGLFVKRDRYCDIGL